MEKIQRKTIEIFCRKYGLAKTYFHIDKTDGLVRCKANLYISYRDFKEIPDFFRYVKIIDGTFSIEHSVNVKSLENLSNLRYVGGSISLASTLIENLKGLENLEYVGKSIFIDGCVNFKSFDGLNPDVEIKDILGNGYKIYPESRDYDFSEWKKSKQIKEISNFLECV